MQFRKSFGRERNFDHGLRSRTDVLKPVKVGEEYDTEIKEMGSRGDGIARIKNFVVFVNNTKVGEKTRIKITEVRNKFAIGKKIAKEEKEMSEEEEPEEEEEVPSEEEETLEEE